MIRDGPPRKGVLPTIKLFLKKLTRVGKPKRRAGVGVNDEMLTKTCKGDVIVQRKTFTRVFAGKRFYLPPLPFSLHFIRAGGSFVLVAFSFVCFFVAGQRNRQLNYFD